MIHPIAKLITLLGFTIIMSTVNAEEMTGTSSTATDVTDNVTEINSEETSELLPEKAVKKEVNVSAQEKRTIKMIVGGQSEDGMAKQVTLPVRD